MINKFKDFLKKLSRKRQHDSSDQEEVFNEHESDENLDHDFTGETPLPDLKPSWKDKLKLSLSAFKKKQQDVVEEDIDEQFDEDLTGETSLPDLRPSWKDKLSFTLAQIKLKVPRLNVRELKIPEKMQIKKNDGGMSLSPSLSKGTERLLSRQGREAVHQVGLVLLICTTTYTAGKLTALFLKGAPALDSARKYAVTINMDNAFNPATLNQVKSINIFRTNTGLGKTKKVADTRCDEAQQASNLPIKLVNTIVLQDSIKSLASVQVRGARELQELRVGDQISNLAKIFKIDRLAIVIKNLESGLCESITSDKLRERVSSPISMMSPSQSRAFIANKKMPGIENKGNQFAISKALLDEKMKDIAVILTQARAIKIQNPDGTMAFKLTEMDPEGIFPYLGLQDQDIITSINGKPIYDMNEVMSLFAKIKNLDKLQLGVKRDGTESVLDYNIKK